MLARRSLHLHQSQSSSLGYSFWRGPSPRSPSVCVLSVRLKSCLAAVCDLLRRSGCGRSYLGALDTSLVEVAEEGVEEIVKL